VFENRELRVISGPKRKRSTKRMEKNTIMKTFMMFRPYYSQNINM
jgi:hypothetical protein